MKDIHAFWMSEESISTSSDTNLHQEQRPFFFFINKHRLGDIKQYHNLLQSTALILLTDGIKHLPEPDVKADVDVNKIKKSGFQAVSVISFQLK